VWLFAGHESSDNGLPTSPARHSRRQRAVGGFPVYELSLSHCRGLPGKNWRSKGLANLSRSSGGG
jgi:hypothetical protein